MTDAEIIKALECCSRGSGDRQDWCTDCPLRGRIEDCETELPEKALDLINRQKAELDKKDTEIDILIRKKETLNDESSGLKAEIERLQKTIIDLNANLSEMINNFTRMESLYKIKCKVLEVAKAEAIKEFAERVKQEIRKYIFIPELEFQCDEVDNLVKEMMDGD